MCRNNEQLGVSVVIPTIGRASVSDAVMSCRNQLGGAVVEVVVVGDISPQEVADLDGRYRLSQSGVLVACTGGGRGACSARNLGLSLASQPMVAFLDDDDVFTTNKFCDQLDAYNSIDYDDVIVAGRARYVMPSGESVLVPATVYNGERMGEDLFLNRRLSVDRNLIPTPTWLMPTSLARRVGWTEGLKRHQDWDFLIRATAVHGARVLQVPQEVAMVRTESEGSITSSAGVNESFEWAVSIKHHIGDAAFSDFVFGQSVRHALQAHAPRAAFRYARGALDASMPSLRCFILAASGLAPRRWMARSMGRSARRVGVGAEIP